MSNFWNLSNIHKTWAVMILFFIFIILIGWIFSLAMRNSFILYISFFIAMMMNIYSYWYSDKLVIRMSKAQLALKSQIPDYYSVVEKLTAAAGLPMPKLYVINDPAPNAFATGRNPENSAIAVTTGLLQRLEKSELEGVLAHELSHIKNRDILLSTVVAVLVGFVAILSDMFLRSVWFRGRDREGGNSNFQLLIFAVGIIFSILAPIASSLVHLSISRKREFLADSSGALMTRNPEGLAVALEKISSYHGELKSASQSTAHLYIANPFRDAGVKKYFSKLFMTHPPIEERIRALRKM